MKDKTVFVLGAGFSMDAGAPSQANIVKAIYNLESKYSSNKKVLKWIKDLDVFLTTSLMVDDKNKFFYDLEDIYTPIDRCLEDGVSFKNYTVKELVDLRYILNRLIVLAVREYISNSKSSKYTIERFGDYLLDLSRERLGDEKIDKVSVITTNWDILLDNYVNGVMKKEKPVKNAAFRGVVDYCCYISSLDEHDHRIKPGLYALGKGGYNLKILKLHGSLNWMQCPKCQRLYVKYYQSFNGGYVFNKKYCRHCEKNYNCKNHVSNQLDLNLIMPTFLKNLNNIQNKLIWQNAGIELSEATKIVFLGYSLPQADFEFKQLLSRMIRPDAKIEVVLLNTDNPDGKSATDRDYRTAGYRYENFFSGRDILISYSGVGKYVASL